ncbi:hypothetical protein NDU88_010049 [Pleurodeles waltl]|uniref:Uncharacterized protein n=1 Tax=Pleurodeles waltl TaxID=8319 RepID=A0AAV7RZE4_PLEWA|nr:hypothetical protein NDU88_010049 [Pleurodeles waltl]
MYTKPICKRPENTEADRTYPGGTSESVHPGPQVIGAAATNLWRRRRRRRGFKTRAERAKMFSPRGEYNATKRHRATLERSRKKATGRRDGANRPATLWEGRRPGRGSGCKHPWNTDADWTYPGGTCKSVHPDPEVIGAAAATLRWTNAEGDGVLKPVQNERRGKEFSPRGEEVDVLECRTSGPEQMPGRGRCYEETPSSPGEKPEEGDQEERWSKQTGHALGRAWPRQVRS